MNAPNGQSPGQPYDEYAAAEPVNQTPFGQAQQNMYSEQPGPNPYVDPRLAAHLGYHHQGYAHQPWTQPDYSVPPPPQWAQQGPYGSQQPWYPPPHGPQFQAQQPPPNSGPSGNPGESGFETLFNDMADQNGLGMLKGMFNFQDGDFWKGALVGAAVVMLVTNENLRDSIMSSLAKSADTVKSGFAGNDTTPDAGEPEQTQSENQQ